MKAYSYIAIWRSCPWPFSCSTVEMAREFAARHSLELDEETSFADLGKSAFRNSHATTGKLRAFLDLIEAGMIERGSTLIIENLDRLSRDNILGAQGLLLQIINAGVAVGTV